MKWHVYIQNQLTVQTKIIIILFTVLPVVKFCAFISKLGLVTQMWHIMGGAWLLLAVSIWRKWEQSDDNVPANKQQNHSEGIKEQSGRDRITLERSEWVYEHPHYRSYWGRVFTGQMTQATVSKHWRKIVHEGHENWKHGL